MFGKKKKTIIRIGNHEIDRNALKKKSKDEIIDFFLAIIKAQEERIAALEETVAKLSKNSSTSSKPPSSDITKPPKPKNATGKKRKQGAQQGHDGASRAPFESQDIDKTEPLHLELCPTCAGDLIARKDIEPKKHQVVELIKKPVIIIEFLQHAFWCPQCKKVHFAPLPAGVIPNQLLGPRLQATIGYMKGTLHCSYSMIFDFCHDVLQIPLSRGLLENTIHRVTDALKAPYEELGAYIKKALTLYIDESGWKDKGIRYWAWVFANHLISFFTIEKSRGSEVLKKILGESFSGAIISDFFSAYVKFANQIQQFCLAHLIRDIKFLTTLKNTQEKYYGRKLLRKFKLLFYLWYKRENIPKKTYERCMNKIIEAIQAILDTTEPLPPNTARLAKRFHKHWDSLFRFAFRKDLEPTNNIAERAIRALVLDRKVTQGSRSEWGRIWSARIWTVLSTCKKQQRSPWEFLTESINAYYFNTSYPSLVPVVR